MAAPEQVVDPYVRDRPWTEADWLELPESPHVELVDGVLVMSPNPRNRHQRINGRLFALLDDAADVVLVAEIVSPGNAAYDRLLKPRLYAEAGVRWCLRIEQATTTAHLHELRDGAYAEVASGTSIDLAEPFAGRLDLPGLLR